MDLIDADLGKYAQESVLRGREQVVQEFEPVEKAVSIHTNTHQHTQITQSSSGLNSRKNWSAQQSFVPLCHPLHLHFLLPPSLPPSISLFLPHMHTQISALFRSLSLSLLSLSLSLSLNPSLPLPLLHTHSCRCRRSQKGERGNTSFVH
jgi:hypothetical protein